MSRRRELERRLHALGEIREIMSAMKNLALAESRKLMLRVATQDRALGSVRAALEELLAFHPALAAPAGAAREVHVLLGSERGFCGDFNEALLRAARALPGPAARFALGTRLGTLLGEDPRAAARLAGPGSLEEVEPALLRLAEALAAWQAAQRPAAALRVTVLHHRVDQAEVAVTRLEPPAPPAAAPRGSAPLLQLEPAALLAQLEEHYLFAALHALCYGSLMAENTRRMQHMDFAVRRIDEQAGALRRRRDRARQEEITEEIEVLMLGGQP